MTTLHNYIKDYIHQKIDYFEEVIDDIMVLISISNNISLGTLLAISTYINKKRNIIANKIQVDYTVYLVQYKFVI